MNINSDNTLITELAHSLGREEADISTLIDGLAQSITERLTDSDSVAIPGFGTFETVKEDEHIVNDLVTGNRLLLPPCISVIFKSSSVLRRKIKNSI